SPPGWQRSRSHRFDTSLTSFPRGGEPPRVPRVSNTAGRPRMRDDVIYRRLGKILWDIAGVETGAATACAVMPPARLLTESERHFLRERMGPEERGHERLLARWGRAWYGARPRRALPYAATVWRDLVAGAHLPQPYRFAYAFATLQWNEVNTLRSARQILPVIEAAERRGAAGRPPIGGGGAGHVAWGGGNRAR